MANGRYDQVPVLAASGQLNWLTDHIVAVVGFPLVAFDSTHTTLSQALDEADPFGKYTAEVPNRYLGPAGEALSQPAVFTRIPAGTGFSVFLVKDTDPTTSLDDPLLLAYYDTDDLAAPLEMTYSGTYLLWPMDVAEATVPQTGLWFTF